MRSAHLFVVVITVSGLWACRQGGSAGGETAATRSQPRASVAPDPSNDVAYVCPMDADIRSSNPGNCPRCGMALVAGIPDPTGFHLDLTVAPAAPKPNQQVQLTFEVFDPWKNNPVKKFSVVHEKLFHAFIVSRDLQFFLHDHPTWDGGVFHFNLKFPKPGMYRILGDFYPEAATPQLLPKTIFVAGPEAPAAPLTPDYSWKQAENLKVDFSITPAQPIAGSPAQMRFTLSPGDGIEKYLGAWGHMLVVSDDLIDMMHTHPFIADGRPEMQFNVVFPRPRMYRVWAQFQRSGVVNTAHFDVPVEAPEPATRN